MKHASLALILTCLLSFTLMAQSDAGKITLGGQVNFSSTTNSTDPSSGESTTTEIAIVPRFGYYISNNIKIGLGVGYISEGTETKPQGGTTTKNTESGFIINPFARFYIPASEKVDLFLEGNFSYQSSTRETDPSTTKFNSSEIGIFVAPGIEFRMSQRISIDASIGQLGYFMGSSKADVPNAVTSKVSSFRLNFNLSTVQLGINIFI